MRLMTFPNRVLRGSTAIAVGLAMSGSPQMVAFAQDAAATVDCVADTENPACVIASDVEAPATEAPPVEAPPVETPAIAEPLVEAPAIVEAQSEVPVEAAPVEAAPMEAPVAEAPAEALPQETAPVAEQAAPVDTAPVPDAPAQETAQPEAETPGAETALEEVMEETLEETPEEVVEAEADATTDAAAQTQPVIVQPVEQTPAEQAPTEAAAEAVPAQAAPTEAPVVAIPAEVTTDITPAEAAPVDEAVTEQPAEAQPVEDTAAQEQPVADQLLELLEPLAEAPEQPDTVADEAAMADENAPASVVSDETTAEQSAQIQAQEVRRREDARERRNELLGAAAVGAVIGAIIPALGGTVVEDQGDRLIVERNGEYFVRRDESSLLRDGDVDVRAERLNNGWTQETVTRRNGAQVITVRDQGGFVIYRSRIRPDGREIVLIDNREMDDRAVIDFNEQLPPLQLTIPQERYVVPARQANYDVIYETFAAQPVQKVDQVYTLRQVRESERLRDLMRRLDLDTITFDTGQAIVRQSQVPFLEDLARASIALIEQDPSTVLLIEGHTDAVGSDISNLALSDRRAETVARILANFYGVPPESMVVQGYGEQYLKVATQGAEERNRRVTIRNITPLLSSR